MFTLFRNLVFGALAMTLAIGTAHVASAKPWPWPKPWPHYYHGPTVIVNPGILTYPQNPIPADILLANPASNQVSLRFTLNGGPVQVLPAGASVAIHQESVIAFDRGGAAGWDRYTLTSGSYRFTPGNGSWNLVQDVAPQPSNSTMAAAANPLPAN